MNKKLSAEELNQQKSHKSGTLGFFENFLRKFQLISYLLGILPVVLLFILALSFALFPLAYLLVLNFEKIGQISSFELGLRIAGSFAVGLLAFILLLPTVVALLNRPIIPFVKSYRGPWFSLESIPWFYHNALFYLVRYTVLDLLTPTPLSLAFLRAMGMKVGRGTMINTSNISDPCLIEVGEHVTIGGSVYMMAHYGMKGFLIVDSLKIENKANVGLHSYLMGAVVVGEAAQILPNTMVLPKTIVPSHARFGAPQARVIEPDKIEGV